jgi:hypothetical protein
MPQSMGHQSYLVIGHQYRYKQFPLGMLKEAWGKVYGKNKRGLRFEFPCHISKWRCGPVALPV